MRYNLYMDNANTNQTPKETTMTTRLTDSQIRDLTDVARGFTRGLSYITCESLCSKGLLRGDWFTGYYATARGNAWLAAAGL